jgi:hypothetical protein
MDSQDGVSQALGPDSRTGSGLAWLRPGGEAQLPAFKVYYELHARITRRDLIVVFEICHEGGDTIRNAEPEHRFGEHSITGRQGPGESSSFSLLQSW